MASAVIRIRRKRSADPHSALLLSFKRSRTDSAGNFRQLYRLAGTASDSDVRTEIEKLARCSQVSSIALADLDADQLTVSDVQGMDLGELPEATDEAEDPSPLACLSDAVGEIGGDVSSEAAGKSQLSSITCNGTPLVRVKATVSADDFVYDLYVKNKSKVADMAAIPADYFADLVDVRLLSAEQELVLVDEADDEESMPDDEDSNDEGNARNDYPDEEDEDSENGSGSDKDDDDVLVERFHRVRFDEDGSFDQFDDDSDVEN